MERVRFRTVRRDELMDATITAIFEEGGIRDTTLAAIGRRAGLSPGLVNHYFDGMQALLEATMRRLARNLAEDIAARMPANPTPLDRLHAVIDGCFSRRTSSRSRWPPGSPSGSRYGAIRALPVSR